MDWHKLQHKLFELDPTDPREDLAKLRAQAQGGSAKVESETVDYLKESAEVPEGSLSLDKDYSVNDFAALAGVRIDEKQKMGSAGQAKGKDPMPKTSKPSSTGEQPHPLKDKLVGEAEEDRISQLEARVAYLESMLEAQTKMPKERNPVVTSMQKSGQGVHKDKKKVFPRKEKHKGKQYESIKDELWARLNAKLP